MRPLLLAALLSSATLPALAASDQGRMVVGWWNGKIACADDAYDVMLVAYPPEVKRDVGSFVVVAPPDSDRHGPASVGAVFETLLPNGDIRLRFGHWWDYDLGGVITVIGRFQDRYHFAGEVTGRGNCTKMTLEIDRDKDVVARYWDMEKDRFKSRQSFILLFNQDYNEAIKPVPEGFWANLADDVSNLWGQAKPLAGAAWNFTMTSAASAWGVASAKAREALALPRNAACQALPAPLGVQASSRSQALAEIERILPPARRSLTSASDREKVVLLQAKLVEIKQAATTLAVERLRTALAACYSDAQLHLAAALSVQEKIPLTDYMALGNALYTNGSYMLGYAEKPDILAGLTGMMAAYDVYSRFALDVDLEMKSYHDAMTTAESLIFSLESARSAYAT